MLPPLARLLGSNTHKLQPTHPAYTHEASARNPGTATSRKPAAGIHVAPGPTHGTLTHQQALLAVVLEPRPYTTTTNRPAASNTGVFRGQSPLNNKKS